MWSCVVGGESTADNCQILQSRVNRLKSNKDHIDSDKLRGYSCDVNFTGKHDYLFTFFNIKPAPLTNCYAFCPEGVLY
jgi:hypothetical protein